jgi:GTP-binding protein
LRHIERTRLLLHLVDLTASDVGDPLVNLDTVNCELIAYARVLAEKPQVVVATKMDLPSAKLAWERLQPALAVRGLRAVAISAVTGEGIGRLLEAIDKALIPVRSAIQSNPSRERTL